MSLYEEDVLADLRRELAAERERTQRLREALKRVLPMARDAKHEDFGDLSGNEDTRTAAVKNAISALAATAPGPVLKGEQ